MSKLIGSINTLDIKDTYQYLDGYIFGIKNLSINFLNTYDLDELKNIIKELKNLNKEIYLVLNKNMHKKDVDLLRIIIPQIEDLNIDGILYSDLCFLTLKNELNINTNLIWYHEHLTVSYTAINTYYDMGIKSAVISNDITYREVLEIIDKTKSKLFFQVFGYIPMFASERNQITNYEKYFNLKGSTNYNYFENNDGLYPIIDSNGTYAYSNKPLYAFDEYLELKNKIDVFILSDIFLSKEDYINILKSFKEENKINFDSSDNFLYKDTIYKIK